MNYLFLDVETTGLSATKHDIIQLAAIPIINNVRKPHFNEFCRPDKWEMDPYAEAAHGISLKSLKDKQSQEEMIKRFIDYVKQFNCQFVIAGYNVNFDKGFVSSTFSKHDQIKEFFKLFTIDTHDTFLKVKDAVKKKQIDPENRKLSTVAEYFDIEIQAHDALSDINATIEVDEALAKIRGEDDTVYERALDPGSIKINTKFPEMAQLHLHSQLSMLDGVPTIEEWAKFLKMNKVPGFSIVDHGSAASLYRMIRLETKDVVGIPGTGLNVKFDDSDSFYSLNAWATSTTGYYNVMKLSSLGYETAIKHKGNSTPIIHIDDVLKYTEGVVFGTAGIDGYIGAAVMSGDAELAEQRYLQLRNLLTDPLVEFIPVDITRIFESRIGFVNVPKNKLITQGNAQKAYNLFLVSMLDKHGGKPIPSSAASFLHKEDKIIQDVLSINAFDDDSYKNESYHFRSTETVYRELKTHIGDWLTEEKYLEWIQNTHDVMNKAQDIEIKQEFHLPKIAIPEAIKQQTTDYNKQIVIYTMERIKMHGRWKDDPVYVERFKMEMDVVRDNEAMDFTPYFLMYDDISEFARNAGFLQSIARGSAGGSLLSYYLKVIHVDPIKHKLPFERFLSHARIRAGSWPDIDMDISKTARPQVMKYLKEKYGCGFAQISTYLTMKTKNAIKDCMWALYGRNRKDREVDVVCKTIPDSPQGVDEIKFLYGYTDKEGETHRGHIDDNEILRNFFKTYPDIQEMVDRMIGIVRGFSRHASAFVISTLDLPYSRTPTMQMYDPHMGEKIQVTQFNAPMVEGSGLVKADILGLKTLAMMADAVKLIKKRGGPDYLEEDENGMALIYRLPEAEAVYVDFYNKKTDSSFQFNTPTIKGGIQEFIPVKRRDLMDMTALFRPGAMDAQIGPVSATQHYMDVKNGRRQLKYIHDDLKEYLKETYGVIVYQEQVMAILVGICGYTLEETDIIRSAIAKKKHAVMMSAFDRIREATNLRGWSAQQSNELCDTIMAFSRYSFNLSHSHAYGELGYITMYLKHFHKLEWWSSVLNNEDKEEKVRDFMTLLGPLITSPSLKAPSDRFAPDDKKICSPLSAIKGVGPVAYKELVEKGPFEDLDDLLARIEHQRVNKGILEKLIKGRAADSLMSDSIMEYSDRRMDLMKRISQFKDDKSDFIFNDDMRDTTPLEVFLMEKSVNKVFNKSLLSDEAVRDYISKQHGELIPTGNSSIPFTYRKVPVIGSVRLATQLLEKDHTDDVGMILLFESSSVHKGISKKTKKPYSLLSIQFSDGYSQLECADWTKDKALGLPKDSVLFIRGTLQPGYRYPVGIKIKQIELIQ